MTVWVLLLLFFSLSVLSLKMNYASRFLGVPGSTSDKEPALHYARGARDTGSVSGLGRSPSIGSGKPGSRRVRHDCESDLLTNLLIWHTYS